MKLPFSPNQISSYRTNGFLVVENFLNHDELEHWRSITLDAVEQRLKSTGISAQSENEPADYYKMVFTQCLKLADTHDQMHCLMHDIRLGEAAGSLAGVDGIRIWHDQALFKPPFGNPTSWHLDNPYWSFSSRDAISIWVALDDATRDNGCLYYLPGTQQTAEQKNASIGHNLADLFLSYPDWRNIDSVACPCPAGSAIFHNGLVAHGAGANMTNRPRRAMTCAYMPDGSIFNGTRNVLPEEYFQSIHVGDALKNDHINPLIWSK